MRDPENPDRPLWFPEIPEPLPETSGSSSSALRSCGGPDIKLLLVNLLFCCPKCPKRSPLIPESAEANWINFFSVPAPSGNRSGGISGVSGNCGLPIRALFRDRQELRRETDGVIVSSVVPSLRTAVGDIRKIYWSLCSLESQSYRKQKTSLEAMS
jgi:hypothetical protein